jgi:hypothetical protein
MFCGPGQPSLNPPPGVQQGCPGAPHASHLPLEQAAPALQYVIVMPPPEGEVNVQQAWPTSPQGVHLFAMHPIPSPHTPAQQG